MNYFVGHFQLSIASMSKVGPALTSNRSLSSFNTHLIVGFIHCAVKTNFATSEVVTAVETTARQVMQA